MHSFFSLGTLLRGRSNTWPAWAALTTFLLLVAADQALKAWSLSHLREGEPALTFVPGLISWVLTFNTGAAWSMFSGSALPLALGRLLVGLGIMGYVISKPQSRALSAVLAMIAAGAVGNAIDGLRFGKVTDMIYSPALSAVTQLLKAGHFPIFNIADSCVVLGTLLLVVLSFRKAS